MKSIIKFSIGNLSYGASKDIYIISNYSSEMLQKGYEDSSKLLDIQFNHNSKLQDFSLDRYICTEYKDNSLSELVIEKFKRYSCPFKELLDTKKFKDEEEFLKVLIWFIGISMPIDFNWEFLDFESFNGLDFQIGYGLFK